MSGPFDPYGADSGANTTIGFPTTYGDSLSASWDQATQVTSFLGLQEDMQKRWEESVRKYNQRIGHDSGADTSMAGMSRTISVDGSDQTSWQEWFLGTNDIRDARQEKLKQDTATVNAELERMNDPTMPGLNTIFAQAKQDRQQVTQRADQTAETGPFGSSVFRFAGGAAGSVTLNDPFNLLTLPFGGFGKTLAVKLGTDVVINAAVSGVSQDQFVNPQARALGEQTQSPWEAALFGGATAGVLHVSALGLGKLAGKALNRAGFNSPELGPLDFNDSQLRSMFEARPEDPTARAGLSALDDGEHFSRGNPYGDTAAGARQFHGEVTDIMAAMQGKTDTAIVRVLPAADDFTIDNLDFHTQIVREQSPEIFDALNVATDKISAIDEQIAQVTGQLDNTSVGDALTKIDETSGALVKALEADAVNPALTQPQRDAVVARAQQIKESLLAKPADLTGEIKAAEDRFNGAQSKAEQLAAARDLDKLYKSAGEDALQKAHDSVTIPLAKEIQSLNASRKAAVKQFKVARSAMDKAIEQVKAAERVKELLNPLGQREALSNPLHYTVAERTGQQIDEASKTLAGSVEALVKEKPEVKDANGAPVKAEPRGDIDLGNGVTIPRDFMFSDPAHPDFGKTAGEIFDDLVEDEKLLEAMRTCAI